MDSLEKGSRPSQKPVCRNFDIAGRGRCSFSDRSTAMAAFEGHEIGANGGFMYRYSTVVGLDARQRVSSNRNPYNLAVGVPIISAELRGDVIGWGRKMCTNWTNGSPSRGEVEKPANAWTLAWQGKLPCSNGPPPHFHPDAGFVLSHNPKTPKWLCQDSRANSITLINEDCCSGQSTCSPCVSFSACT